MIAKLAQPKICSGRKVLIYTIHFDEILSSFALEETIKGIAEVLVKRLWEKKKILYSR